MQSEKNVRLKNNCVGGKIVWLEKMCSRREIVQLEKCAVGEKLCSWKNVQSENECPVGENCVFGKMCS